jgi:hypothetical protein
MNPSQRAEYMAELSRKSAERRAGRMEARRDLEKQAQMGLRALLGARLEAKAAAVATRLEELALSTDDATALRGLGLWMDRVFGRSVQPTREETPPPMPDNLEELEALSWDEQLALLRSLGDVEPSPVQTTDPRLAVRQEVLQDRARARNGTDIS